MWRFKDFQLSSEGVLMGTEERGVRLFISFRSLLFRVLFPLYYHVVDRFASVNIRRNLCLRALCCRTTFVSPKTIHIFVKLTTKQLIMYFYIIFSLVISHRMQQTFINLTANMFLSKNIERFDHYVVNLRIAPSNMMMQPKPTI